MNIPNFQFSKIKPKVSLLNGMSIIYLIAFFSLFLQWKGLFSSVGILPIQSYISLILNKIGWASLYKVPSLFLFGSSDTFIQLSLLLGILLSVLSIVSKHPFWYFLVNWILYLSFVNVGQAFLSFQWDILLIEAGFMMLFIAPIPFFWQGDE